MNPICGPVKNADGIVFADKATAAGLGTRKATAYNNCPVTQK